jgi:diguanylate cyclase (GGDEF)-like protein
MAKALTRHQPLSAVLETAAENACPALHAATVSISRVYAESNLVRTFINVGDLGPGEERWPDNEVFPFTGEQRLTSAVLDWRSWTSNVFDPDCHPREREALQRLGKGSSLATPILVDGRVWGEFYATRHIGDPPFDEDAVAYAEVLVAILASAVSNTLREAALENLAFHDALTGLLNRRGLDNAMSAMFDLGDEPSRAVSIVAMDIDGLKKVNDTEGHLRGDQQICQVADALEAAVSQLPTGVVARIGGDEFMAIASGDDVYKIEALINQACREVSARDSTIGLSAGIASTILTPGSLMTSLELGAAADRAQYVAKRTRSRVAIIADDVSV